ncbi:MAG: hypothetical protein GY833_21625 [Aestuariibacter sp.]|nr:hypothetical protein [Aestuariibacter sp.]
MKLMVNHVDNDNVEILYINKPISTAYREVDGTFHLSFQESIGGWPSWILYEMAFILDELNKATELETRQANSVGGLKAFYRRGELHIDSNHLSYTGLHGVYKSTDSNPAGDGEALQVNDPAKESEIRAICQRIAENFYSLEDLTEQSNHETN